ncbi:hypothetical protein HAX54_010620 [Datura stramonium]|uniref:C2H2-type domain-containing protein n=1 Tax=Datura stramonium TaxID=4076 RepID=A0ABS8TGM5_DATST|nr:hypothetical protein [Datura stramonium]
MEQDQDLKFVCKLCNKKYPCGKSLGGHMRSHVLANSAEFDEKIEANKLKKVESWTSSSGKNQTKLELGGISSSYGLRENPKKTWRAEDSKPCYSESPKIMPHTSLGGSDTHPSTFQIPSNLDSKYSPLPQEKVCQQCGKVFQSLKALCGHMACHSAKDKWGFKDADDNSWTSDHSHSDTEADELISQRRRSKTTKRYKNIIVKSLNNYNCSSSVSAIDQEQEQEQEQEELAKCLMMLSRDSWIWNGVETSDNNSVVLETKSSSTDMRNNARKNSLNTCVYNQDDKPRTKKEGDRNTKVDMLEAETQSENSDSDYYLGENGNGESDGSVEGFLGNGKCKWSTSKMNVGAWLDEHRTDEKKVTNRIKRDLIESRKDLSKKFERDGYGLASNTDISEARKRTTDRYNHPEITNDSKKRKFSTKGPEGLKNDIHKKRKYECLNCKKIFSSYQALGGHRPCHKKINDYSESTYETGENSPGGADNDPKCINIGKHRDGFRNKRPAVPAQDLPYEPEKKVKPKKSKGHKCPFCHRIFKSGQALGGHKRTHFIHGGDQENLNQQSSAGKREVADLLDLNLPAPVDDEDDEHAPFMSWCMWDPPKASVFLKDPKEVLVESEQRRTSAGAPSRPPTSLYQPLQYLAVPLSSLLRLHCFSPKFKG